MPTTIVIVLRIDGSHEDASAAANRLIASGALRDHIDSQPHVEYLSAVTHAADVLCDTLGTADKKKAPPRGRLTDKEVRSAERAARDETTSWIDGLDAGSFADTHGISGRAAKYAIALLAAASTLHNNTR